MANNQEPTLANSPQVQQAQTTILFAHLPNIIVSSMVAAVILVVIQWSVINHTTLLTWLTLLGASFMVRAFIYYQYQQSISKDSQQWSQYFLTSTIPTFIIWGTAGIFLFPEDEPIYQAITILTLFGISAGATDRKSVV